KWPEAWVLIIFYIVSILGVIFWLKKNDPGLDAVRFRWSNVPLLLKIIGFLGFIPGFILGFWAMRENTYLSDFVRIQDDRGHKVCKTGPYRFVRHPMYVGTIFLSIGGLQYCF
ncbi:MAG: hypothetical protein MUP98_15610, partial [Candidatus Aminicenantes bacterium]|nr:hypothetical protein [Candidatus Aminicenantes bacterium]